MLISTTRPTTEVTDESGTTIGTFTHPLEAKDRTVLDALEDILMELRTMNEHLLEIRGAF